MMHFQDILLSLRFEYEAEPMLWQAAWNHMPQLSQATPLSFQVTVLSHVPQGYFVELLLLQDIIDLTIRILDQSTTRLGLTELSYVIK